VIEILESDVFTDICKTENPALKLFWEDTRKRVEEALSMPLSELKAYQLKAAQALNYSI
jgi:malate synthase